MRTVYLAEIQDNDAMEVETDGTTDHPVIRTVIEMLDILGIYGDFESQYMASLRIEWSVPSIIELFYRDYSYRSLLHSTIKEYIHHIQHVLSTVKMTQLGNK